MISMVTLLKGLKHVGLKLDLGLGSTVRQCMPVSAVIGLLVAALGASLLQRDQGCPK